MIGMGGYLAASGLVALTVLSIGWAAERIRRSAGLDGTLAAGLLAWSLISLGLLTSLAFVLGAVGVLGRYQLVAGALVIAGLSELIWRRRGRSRSPSLLGPVTFDRWGLAGAALVVAAWLAGVNHSWDVGLTGFDTLSYHLPFAYAFAFEGGLRQYTFVDVSYLHHFYPAGSELLNATGLALVGRDLLVPFLNFGFALVALLAAWVLGSRLGSARVGLLAVVPLMVSGVMVRQQAGVASSDIGAAAMALSAFAAAAIALDRDSWRSGPSATAWLAVAGVAAGLGIGIKLTAGAPLAVLVLWLAWAAWRDERLRAGFGIFLLGLALIGLPWELRNLILSGNPVPFIKAIGPIELPYPARGFEGRDPFSVAHYLADPSRSVLTDYFLPGLNRTLGWAWPLILLLGLFGAVWSLVKAGSRGRAIAVAALLGGVLYLVTPFSAAGPEGFPMGFAWNLRYLAPALIIGLCLLAAWGGQQNPRGGWARITPVLLIAVAVLTAVSSDLLDLWKGLDLLWILGAALIAMVTVAILRRPRAPLIPVAVGAVALGIFLVGLFDRSAYLERPTADTPRDFAGDRSLQIAASDLDGQTLGITGHLAALEQYRLRGADFGTEVLYVGVEQSNGGFRAVRSCRELERVIRDEGIDIIAASPDRDFDSPNRLEVLPEVASAREIGQARFLQRYRTEGRIEYYRVIPEASGCRPDPR